LVIDTTNVDPHQASEETLALLPQRGYLAG
jgi:hypothetical protein